MSSTPSNTLRPILLKNFVGQTAIKEQLEVMISSARSRKTALNHVLFHGPPGLGKTTLSHIIAQELGVPFKPVMGPALEKPADIVSLLSSIEPNTVVFVDEIHRLHPQLEEYLYSAMEDFYIDILIEGTQANTPIRLNLPKFTLVGATTRLGLLTPPLVSRFPMLCRLEPYTLEEIQDITRSNAKTLGLNIHEDSLPTIARCSRGTPRLANNILLFSLDYATHHKLPILDLKSITKILDLLQIDQTGLNQLDRRYLAILQKQFKGKPAGLNSLAAALNEDAQTLEETTEPFLIQTGLIQRTHTGRKLTPQGTALVSQQAHLFT